MWDGLCRCRSTADNWFHQAYPLSRTSRPNPFLCHKAWKCTKFAREKHHWDIRFYSFDFLGWQGNGILSILPLLWFHQKVVRKQNLASNRPWLQMWYSRNLLIELKSEQNAIWKYFSKDENTVELIVPREYGLRNRSLISLTSWGNQIGLLDWFS